MNLDTNIGQETPTFVKGSWEKDGSVVVDSVMSQNDDDSCVCVCVCVCVCACTRAQSCLTPGTIPYQAPLSMEFSRQEYWNVLSFPPSGDLPDPGTKFMSLALAGGFFATSVIWEALMVCSDCQTRRQIQTW